MNIFLWFLVIMMFFTLLLYFSKGHFFSMLISFEGIMLFIFYIFSSSFTDISLSLDSVMIILSLMVMEGTMGLSILIYSVNWFGRDFVFMMSSK